MEIILVEDNKGDIYLIKQALKEENISLIVFTDGGKAIPYITSNYSKPDLIILDINLPHYNGFQILEVIRNSEDMKLVPVVIFTSSTSTEDTKKAYDLGASMFSNKPNTNEEYFQKVKSFLELIPDK